MKVTPALWIPHYSNLCIFNFLYWTSSFLEIRVGMHLFSIPSSTKYYPLNIDVWNAGLTHNFFLILLLYTVLRSSPLKLYLTSIFFFTNCLHTFPFINTANLKPLKYSISNFKYWKTKHIFKCIETKQTSSYHRVFKI